LIYELDQDILELYLRTKNEDSRLRLSKVKRDKNTDALDGGHYHAAFADGKIS